MTNMDLWHAVEKTPPSETKEITGKPYKGNSPKPHYLIRKATETFGPCGIGWGFTILEEKLLDGALLLPDFRERIHMAHVRVWYIYKDKRGEVEHVGQTLFCGKRRDGSLFTDEDAPKKSVTDALVKAMSMIGFAGDIFAGRYDDSKYVAELRQEEAAQKRQEASQAPATAHRPTTTTPKAQAPQQSAAAQEPASGKRDFDWPSVQARNVPAKEMAQAFCNGMTECIRVAEDAGDLAQLETANKQAMNWLATAVPAGYAQLKAQIAARLDEIANGPMATAGG